MKLKFWQILAIPALTIVMVGSSFAQTAEMFWIENGGAGGTLEGILREDRPYNCVKLGDPKFPQVNPTPTNPDGSKANCYPAEPPDLSSSTTRGGLKVSDSIDILEPDLGFTVSGSPDAWGQVTPNFGMTQKGQVLFPEIELHTRTDVTVQKPGISVAEMNSSVSYYGESINCNCVAGETVSIRLSLGADFSGQGSSVGVQVRAFSDVGMTNDAFNQCSPFCYTSQLVIGASRTFSVIITLGVTAQGDGSSAIGDVSSEVASVVGLSGDEIIDPGGSIGTSPRAITNPPATGGLGAFNSQLVSGWYNTAGGTEGFQILADGTIKAPIMDPNDTLHFTEITGINNAGTIVGTFENTTDPGTTTPADTFHGFFLTPSGTFTTFDIGQPGVSTGIQAINSNGDVAGDFGSNSQASQGFLLPNGGTAVTFGVPGLSTFPQAINDSDTVVGVYQDKSGNYHGFEWTVAAGLTSFDYPGAASTHAEGINNGGTINGYFTDSAGNTHGFFGPFGAFQQYDLSGEAGTYGRGINDSGFITGSFADSTGQQHGFATQLCASNVSADVTVTQGPITFDSTTGEYVQTVTLKNTGTTAIKGPLYLVFNNLPQGIFIADLGVGVSLCSAPQLPYVSIVLAHPNLTPGNGPNSSVSANIFFVNTSNNTISYTPGVLAGPQVP